jgi:hypothetical protein
MLIMAQYIFLKCPRHRPRPIELAEVWIEEQKLWLSEVGGNLSRCLVEPGLILDNLTLTASFATALDASMFPWSDHTYLACCQILRLHLAGAFASQGARFTTQLGGVTWSIVHTQRHPQVNRAAS